MRASMKTPNKAKINVNCREISASVADARWVYSSRLDLKHE